MRRQKVQHCYLLAIVLIVLISYNGNVTRVVKAFKKPFFVTSDALIPPDIPPKHNSSITPGYYETSEYLIGSVAVGIVFLESNGTIDPSTEDWTSTRESWVVSEICDSGLSWLANYNPGAGVSFVYDIHYRVPTSYEPIKHPQTYQRHWISEAMTYLGYPGTFYFTQVRDYINNLRDTLDTDWAFTIFVVDSYHDSDGTFTDDKFAYSYLGGPFLVMTYDNNGWGIRNMDNVVVHETAHIFYATDEYDGVAEYSGYLNVLDDDEAYCIMNPDASIFPIWTICPATEGQLGWRDTDGDGIQDIVDTFPDTTLDPYFPDPTDNTTLVYTGSVTEIPYPNNNPHGTFRDVTTNTITLVQFRMDSGAWINANATDGIFDEAVEAFTFTTSSLSSGTHIIETRGINSVGNAETSYSNDTVTILVDSNPPTTIHGYDGLWHTTDFTFNLTATDDFSGVADTYYKINDGPTKNVSINGQPIITTEGVNNSLEYWSVDNADNEEFPHNLIGIKLDKTAPTGSIAINKTGAYITSISVTLTVTATDETSGVYQVRFSNDGLWDTEPWETPSPTKAWTLTSGDGTKNVYYQIRDNAGLISETYSDTIILDITPPIGSITINSDAPYTTTNTVTLTLSATDATSDIAEMRFSNDNNTWTPWEAYTVSKAWALAIGDGTKTVYYQVRDHAGLVSDTYSDTIVLDTNPPTISEIFPSNGTEIRSSTITPTWSGSDATSDIDHYEIRLNAGSLINTGTNTTYTFTETNDGSHVLDIKAVDRANRYRQVRIRFSVNTSLIGGPGWTDDIVVFGVLGFLIVGALLLFIKKSREKKR